MGILSLIVGVLLFVVGILQYFKTKKLLKEGLNAKGVVIEVKQKESQSTDSEGYSTTTMLFYPVYEFVAKDRMKYTIDSNVGYGNANQITLGQELDIIYEEKNPNGARIKKFGNLWLTSIILIPLGLLLIVIGIASSF